MGKGGGGLGGGGGMGEGGGGLLGTHTGICFNTVAGSGHLR